jgi:hypothetical protein
MTRSLLKAEYGVNHPYEIDRGMGLLAEAEDLALR